jgi:hypothetical protein
MFDYDLINIGRQVRMIVLCLTRSLQHYNSIYKTSIELVINPSKIHIEANSLEYYIYI